MYLSSHLLIEVHDASDLSAYCDRKFDFAVTSMAIHQFDPQLAIKILPQMKRIAYGTESMAGGDLYHNFLKYMSAGGLGHFTDAAGLYIKSKSIKGNGVFVVAGYE